MVFSSSSPETTGKIASLLAEEIKKTGGSDRALVLGLFGNLGAGKTTFVQSLARALDVKKKITSPTFLIIKNYKLGIKNYGKLYHIDCYRLKKPEELLALDFKNIIENPENIVVIEWADKVKKILPKKIIRIDFKHGSGETERKIIFRIKKQ